MLKRQCLLSDLIADDFEGAPTRADRATSGTALPKSCCLSLPFQNNLVALLYLQDFLTMTRSIIAALLALVLEIRATKSAAVNSKFSDLIPWESQSRGSDCEPRTKTGRHFS